MDGKSAIMWTFGGVSYSASVVMAARDESGTIAQVIEGVKSLSIIDNIVVVDDGSEDGTSEIAKKFGCIVIENGTSIGQTRSLKKGIKLAETDVVVTMDADMDHLPSDIPRLLTTLYERRADVVIGGRSALPRIAERIMSRVVSRKTGIHDTISGFRAITMRTLSEVDFDDGDTWGSLFLIRCAKKKLKLVEVPVQTPPARPVTRTGGALKANAKILRALALDMLCMAGMI